MLQWYLQLFLSSKLFCEVVEVHLTAVEYLFLAYAHTNLSYSMVVTFYSPGIMKKWQYCSSYQFDETATKVSWFRKDSCDKKIHQWCQHDCHVTWLQFTDHTQNENYIWCLKFYLHKWFQTLSDMLGWNKIHQWRYHTYDMTYLQFVDETHKMRTRFGISSSTNTIDFKLRHFIRYLRLTKEFYQWYHYDCHVT